jgi:hypothetical protein
VARRLAAAVVLAALAGCGGPSMLPLTRSTRGRLIAEPPVRVRRPAAWELAARTPEPLPDGRPFAASPITPFADAITDLALAAVEGRTLPPSPVPFRHPVDGAPVLEWSSRTTPRPAHLTVLAMALQLDLVLKRGTPADDAVGIDRWGTLRTTVVVGHNGLRIVSLRPAAMTPHGTEGAPPHGLEGLRELATTLIADLRRGDVSAYELTDEDRRILANDAVWAEIYEDGPPLARAPQIAAMLEGLPNTPLAYGLDDLGVLVRDEEGRLYSLTLELDPTPDGSFALATTPLVEVRRLWPR